MTNLSNARILISNDDGIHAPGLKVLEKIAHQLSEDVWTVAPETEQSATSHSLTTRRPVYTRRFGERRVAVTGTPTDCVVVAVNKVLKDKRPDLVLSGINHGGNLAEDVLYSGTVAAAMEGATLGVPAIAFSQTRNGDAPIDFTVAEYFLPDLIRGLHRISWKRDLLINVNFPACAPDEVSGVRVCRQGRRDEQTGVIEGRDPGGRPYIWIGDWASDRTEATDTDLAVIAERGISVTPLHLDLTHSESLAPLAEALR